MIRAGSIFTKNILLALIFITVYVFTFFLSLDIKLLNYLTNVITLSRFIGEYVIKLPTLWFYFYFLSSKRQNVIFKWVSWFIHFLRKHVNSHFLPSLNVLLYKGLQLFTKTVYIFFFLRKHCKHFLFLI